MAPTQNHPIHKLHRHFSRSRLALTIAAQCAGAILSFAPLAYAQEDAVVVDNAPIKADPNEQLRELDWVPYEELTDEQKALIPTACCGAYIAPARDDAESGLDPEKANIFGTADYSESEKQTKFIMRDNVHLTQGRRSFHADTFT
jgi:LPS-assembly protein